MERREEWIKSLRECADFFENNPEIPVPFGRTEFNIFVLSKTELARYARLGTWEKVYIGNYFILRKTFGDECLSYEINANRETVCRREVIGTKIIPAQPEREVDEFRWVCEEPVLVER